ncbi:MAG: class I SAM-dependent methyltransferase [Candidatus Binataceae bacterium]
MAAYDGAGSIAHGTGVMMDERMKTNLAKWNAVVPVHARSEMYNLAGFKAGRISLHELEVAEVGDVHGKSLLHLQCHFGLDTMSWARLGATVTGIDFSDQAIKLARSISEELRIPARFICADLYDALEIAIAQTRACPTVLNKPDLSSSASDWSRSSLPVVFNCTALCSQESAESYRERKPVAQWGTGCLHFVGLGKSGNGRNHQVPAHERERGGVAERHEVPAFVRVIPASGR